ncbi:hypothetical protein KI688_002979 [Linnemannia hyalina]|uniref:Uncharacterized protein n=1 Tax=Linnemannia hyalina TaxID=64524 RepID=A0A9P8BQS6_9FUNG|nr:hypothetical protein KI688_002979 [Linnemannia hyalina]
MQCFVNLMTSSTTVPSLSPSSHPAPSASPTSAELGGSIPRSRSSTGIGLPPKYGSGYSASSSPSSGGSVLGHSNNQHLWASSRHRSVSNSGPLPSNGATSGSSHGNRSSVISSPSQGLVYPSYSESNTASKQQQQPQHNSPQQRQSAGSSASLMEIYAQQQQLQQYSNQRAQLSPTQVQQMYIMRNSRSNSSLTSAATAVAEISPTTTAGTPGAIPLPGVIGTASTISDTAVLGHDTDQPPMSPKDDSSMSLPLTTRQVTVMFESTSFSVQDPSHPNYIGNKTSTAQALVPTPTSPVTPTGAGSVASLPLLVSTASSFSSTPMGVPSPSFPGKYPGSATPNNTIHNGGNKRLNDAKPLPIDSSM